MEILIVTAVALGVALGIYVHYRVNRKLKGMESEVRGLRLIRRTDTGIGTIGLSIGALILVGLLVLLLLNLLY